MANHAEPLPSDSPLGLYVHIPFCVRRCSYCAFNTYSGLEGLIPAYVDALCCEIAWIGTATGQRLVLDTVYFGGGTPSMLSTEQVARILQTVRAVFEIREPVEITLEANPAGISREYLEEIRCLGINRLSLGAQSAQAAELELLRRRHDWTDVIVTVQAAHAAGFHNLSLDLIYGLPGQSLDSWRESLTQAVALEPDHLSLYCLGIEPGTAMHRWIRTGRATEPDTDLAADMYDYAGDYLSHQGFAQYEISNWAKPGFACQHNLKYWRRASYLGIGAGAYGFVDPVRYGNVDRPEKYIHFMLGSQRSESLAEQGECHFPLSPAVDKTKVETLDLRQARAETMILGLRLVEEGVPHATFEKRFGQTIHACYGNELTMLETRGLLRCLDDRIVLTPQARLVANLVLKEFV